jgi:integrase
VKGGNTPMEGSIRPRGSTWEYRFSYRDPITRKRKYKSKGGFKKEKDAEKACRKAIVEFENGGYIEPGKITVSQFMQEYIDNEVIPNLRPSTLVNYKNTLTKLNESIGNIELGKLNALNLPLFPKHLREQGLAASTINTYLTVFKRILNVAHEYRLMNYNLSHVLKRSKTVRKIDKYWSYDVCMNFLETVRNDKYYLIYLLTLFTGLRRGEVLGLSEDTCDFENNIIDVRQQVATVKNKPILSPKLKSDSSYRVIEVPAAIMQLLKDYYHEKKKVFFQLGIRNEHRLLFTTEKGTMIAPAFLSRCFKETVEKYDFKNITFHGLRHSHATILSEAKESVHAIQERLGHSTPTITNEMYIHNTDKMKHSLLDQLEKLYEKNA